MKAKLLIFSLSISMLIVIISLLYAFPKSTLISEEENWLIISNSLQCFLKDPMTNYQRIEEIEDLFYWTNVYVEIYGGDYIRELFARHFQVRDIDSKKLDIILSLLIKYSWPPNWDDVGMKPIVSRIVEIIKDRPIWFFKELINRLDWKEILRLIALDKTVSLRDYFVRIPYQDIRAELISALEEIEIEKKTEVQRLEEFLKDPINNFDKIKNIFFLCSAMAIHDWSHINKDKILPEEENSLAIISNFIEEKPDEKKVDILLHLISHCTTWGYEPEIIMELGAKVFVQNPVLFARCLSKHKGWRSILYLISYFLSYEDPGFRTIINRLGNSNFENNLKSQLDFLSFIEEKRIKGIR